MDVVVAHDSYFQQKHDDCNILGLSSIQKCTKVIMMLACGVIVDVCDEYCRLGELIAMETLKRFGGSTSCCSHNSL
jgi:hypothetical protein